MIITADKVQSIKQCELSTVIIQYVEVVSMMVVYTVGTVLYVYSLCWCFLYAGMIRTELEVDVELCGVPSCDVIHFGPVYVRFVVETVAVGQVSY